LVDIAENSDGAKVAPSALEPPSAQRFLADGGPRSGGPVDEVVALLQIN
jgi:hypothetical protein